MKTKKKYLMLVFEENSDKSLEFYSDNPYRGRLSDIVYGDTLKERVASLEIRERQKYHYYCDCSDQWTTEENKKYQSQWNEIIQMLNEAKEELKNISLIQEEKN